MNNRIEQLQQTIEPLKQQIINHPLYSVIRGIGDVRIFMQYHVYAVWDFMSLLKKLQQNLTCTAVPWFPKGNAETRYLINEIVAGEESDIDENGIRTSHFELYLQAMNQSGADTAVMQQFCDTLQQSNLSTAFEAANVPAAAREFVSFTFDTIASNKDHVLAAVFCFGREDLIPGMFHSMVQDLSNEMPASISTFKYYLERHIEVDGDHHSELALRMTANLCGNDEKKWQEAELAVTEALNKRITLWNGAYETIKAQSAIIA